MSLAAALFNRSLAREPWAQARLAAHAGATFAVVVGPATAIYTIAADGTVAKADVPATLTLTVSPLNVPALLAQPGRWSELVTATGDAGLASTLSDLTLTLPWLIESAFARVLGPVVGSRVADSARSLLTMPEYAAGRVGASVTRYVTDESRLVANKQDFRTLADDAASLADRVDALDARIAALNAARLT